MMVMCRGENVATVQTLAGGFCFIARELEDVTKLVATLMKLYHNSEVEVIRSSQRSLSGLPVITDGPRKEFRI